MSNPKDFAKFVGRSAVLEYATTVTGSGPAPQESDWKPGGAIRSKSFDLSPNTVTSEADDAGGFPESLVTNSDLSISVEGEFRKKDKEDEIGINALIKLYVNAVKANIHIVRLCLLMTVVRSVILHLFAMAVYAKKK